MLARHTNAPRKTQKFIDAPKAAPDKTLCSNDWQRPASEFSDKANDAFPAWI